MRLLPSCYQGLTEDATRAIPPVKPQQEVMDKAQKENWASPGAYPEWAQRIHFYGDFRARYQGSFFPKGNDQLDAFDFNAINSGSPYDLANTLNAPTYNASQDRHQVRLRARLGMEADLTNSFNAGFRIATGQDNSPVSTNQTLCNSGGNFSKYQLWLDRAYLTYQTWNQDFVASVGRFDNPFWSPIDLAWYKELAFDGFAIQGRHQVSENFTPFGVIGAFPIFNTSFNIGTNRLFDLPDLPMKLPSHDKWLFGGQLGAASGFDPDTRFRLAVAYYDFENIQGQVSSACDVGSSADVCSSDLSRPSFAQKGNTYMALRNLTPASDNSFGNANLFQFFGLVQKFRPVVGTAQLDFGQFNPYHIVIDGEFIWNSAFNRALTVPTVGLGVAINNRAGTQDGSAGPFNGGDQGWMVRMTVGNKDIKQFGDWNVHAGYKFLESDATLDAFVDSDFGQGGTNLKGYFVGGNLGLSNNVWASMRWMSATNIAGVPYAVDVLFVDLNAKF